MSSVREVLFWVSTGSVVTLAGILIAAVWKLVDHDIAGRSAATIAIIGASAVTLSLIQGYLR